MKKVKGFQFIVIMVCILAIVVFSGCGLNNTPDGSQKPTPTVTPEPTHDNDITPIPDDKDEVIRVSTPKELLEAIAPGAKIFVEPGYYNLSEYIEGVWEEEGIFWNAAHPYVQLYECHDGVEVIIQNADNLSIVGDVERVADTEIVVEPRYAAIFTFINCNQIDLSFLTMGHTETGECEGNVLDFYDCQNITMSAMDLYGCGVYGIGAYAGTGEMSVYSSTIRECEFGPFDIQGVIGKFAFENCSLVDSNGSGYFEKTDECELYFKECIMGQNESNGWYFREDIVTEDCIWSEITEYPDYEESFVEFDLENMEQISVTERFLHDTNWDGYSVVDMQSGNTTYLPTEDMEHAFMSLDAYGMGRMEYFGESVESSWKCEVDNSVRFETADGWYMYAEFYASYGDVENGIWMMLKKDNDIIWLYQCDSFG